MRRCGVREPYSLGWVVTVWALSGCLYDSDERCSKGERVNADGYCVCMPNHVTKPRDATVLVSETQGPLGREGCVTCGAHQVPKDDTCVCESGFTANADGDCLKSTVADVNFGDACTSDADCTGPGATCIDDDELGEATRSAYCSTRGCKDVSACPASDGFGCFEGAEGKFCRKPPTGEGDACDMGAGDVTNPACKSEATACAFDRCTAPFMCRGDDDCTPGLICCDLSAIVMDTRICTTSAACPVD